jgi:prepilin-type N-terminal cleavage/methylation domain-containing protein
MNTKILIRKKYRGFSLIELMVVIGIIAIMSIILLVSFNSNKSQSRLKVAQRETASAIKLAQSYALQGKTQGGATPCGYGFIFTLNNQYQIYYNLPGASTCTIRNSDVNYRHYRASAPDASVLGESAALKSGVILSPYSQNNTDIYFTVPQANTYKNAGTAYDVAQTLTFSSTISGTTNTKTITINPGGYVTEN